MKRTILVFAALIFGILLLFRLSSYSLIKQNWEVEFVLAIVAIVFFFIGIYMHKKSLKRTAADPIAKEIDRDKIRELGLSDREYEVLCKMEKGLSNKQIGAQLFISESTVKTHVSSVLLKLDAKRRTQAIAQAQALNIL